MTDRYVGVHLCSLYRDGPWTAVFAGSYEEAARRFAIAEALRSGDKVFVGKPAPTPDIFNEDALVDFIIARIDIPVTEELSEMARGLAAEANYRLDRFAARNAEDIGRVVSVKHLVVPDNMPAVRMCLNA